MRSAREETGDADNLKGPMNKYVVAYEKFFTKPHFITVEAADRASAVIVARHLLESEPEARLGTINVVKKVNQKKGP